MELGSVILIGAAVIVVLVLVDLLLLGGTMTMGTMHGMAVMMSNPIGQAVLLVLIAILGVLVYAVFFR